MSLLRKLTGIGLTLGLVLAFSAIAFAQQPTTQAPQEGLQQQERMERRGKHRGMGKKGDRILRLMEQLNLTEAQQQQLRAIEERFAANSKPRREELRRLHESNPSGTLSAEAEARLQALRAEMRQAMRSRHEEMLAILSPEQRAQLEQLVQERKARRRERRGLRMDRQDDDQ
jgi:Spy/CpxP family protein refolding chaperone